MKRFLSIILSATMIFSLAGCGSRSAENSEIEAGNVSDVKDIIKMITWTNDGTVEALETLNEKFYKETGILVELVHVESPDYDAFLDERISANDVDIFCYTTDSKAFAQPMVDWAPSEMLPWEKIIKNGNALDLSGYNFIKNWSTGADACKYEDGIYGIATGLTIMNGLFYNRKLFEENGWHEPRTWKEFITLCDNIKAAGIEPITVGGADKWPVQMITNAIVDSVVEGKSEELIEGLWKGTRTYTDDESMEIYKRESQILSYLEDDFMNVAYADAPARFAEGKTAMFYSGSWNAADIEAANPKFEYDYFAIPGEDKHNFTGKYDLTFGVNAKSEKSNLAVKWLEFFSAPENYTIYINSNGFIPTMSWISTSNSFLVKIDDRLSDSGRTFECYNRVPTNMGAYGTYDLINYKIAGGVFDTPEEFAEAAKKDWDDAMQNITNR